VAKVTLTIEQGKEVVAARGEFLDAERVPPDREMVALTARHQEAALAYVRTVVATAAGAFPGGFAARCQDGPLADLINHVQLGMAEAAGFPAQISATSIFTEEGHLDPGPVRLADLYALYPYENTLTVLEISGRTLRQALEHNARYWKTWDVAGPPPDGLASLVSEGAKPYGWDLYSGVAFKLDLSKPAGRRVAELRCGGQAVTPEQTYRIALNNYRAGGGGGFWMFRDAKAVWRSESEIRDALVQHVTAAGRLAPESYFTANWAFLPESLNPPGGTSDRETPAAASAP
jgi:2',3'-cyclic-nucleotide 2'-phosphodiesterase/3'-nucleotidase